MTNTNKCADCTAFQRKHDKGGLCRANPPQVLVFGMEAVQVPGLRGGASGHRPLTGTGFPEVTNDGWCRDGFRPIAKQAPAFDPSKLKALGDAQSLNGHPQIGEQS